MKLFHDSTIKLATVILLTERQELKRGAETSPIYFILEVCHIILSFLLQI